MVDKYKIFYIIIFCNRLGEGGGRWQVPAALLCVMCWYVHCIENPTSPNQAMTANLQLSAPLCCGTRMTAGRSYFSVGRLLRVKSIFVTHTSDCQTVPKKWRINCTKLHQIVPNSNKLYQTSSSCTKLQQTVPNFIKLYQTALNCTKLHQIVPNCLKCTKLH